MSARNLNARFALLGGVDLALPAREPVVNYVSADVHARYQRTVRHDERRVGAGGDTWISGQLAGLDRASWGSVRTVPSIGRLQSAPQDAGGPPKAVYDRMVHSCSHPTPRHSIPLQ